MDDNSVVRCSRKRFYTTHVLCIFNMAGVSQSSTWLLLSVNISTIISHVSSFFFFWVHEYDTVMTSKTASAFKPAIKSLHRKEAGGYWRAMTRYEETVGRHLLSLRLFDTQTVCVAEIKCCASSEKMAGINHKVHNIPFSALVKLLQQTSAWCE